MEKKIQDVLFENKERSVIILVILLVFVGSMIVYINVKGDVFSSKIDVNANMYSGDDFISEEKTVNYEYRPRVERVKKVTKVIYVEDDDPDRYPIEDYKYGYTYRATDEYREAHLKVIIEYEESDDYEVVEFGEGVGDEYYYYEYVDYLDEYEKVICYKSAPADKLFYVRCPGY